MIAGKVPENDVIPGVSTELMAFLEDDEEGYILEDKKVEEVMHELLKEINGGSNGKNVWMLGASSSFYISGESCGPAFSGSGSTLMAGIEMGCGASSLGVGGGGDSVSLETAGVGLGGPTVEMFSGLQVGFSVYNGPWVVEGKGKEKSMQEGEKEEEAEIEKMDGCDEEEGEDEWLTRVLSCAPQVLDDYGM